MLPRVGLFSNCQSNKNYALIGVAERNYHETEQSCEYGRHTPRRVPRVGVEIGYAETELLVGAKPSIGGYHVDRGGLEREFAGEDELTVVETPFVGRVFGPAHYIVPATYITTLRLHVPITYHCKIFEGTGSAVMYGTGSPFSLK